MKHLPLNGSCDFEYYIVIIIKFSSDAYIFEDCLKIVYHFLCFPGRLFQVLATTNQNEQWQVTCANNGAATIADVLKMDQEITWFVSLTVYHCGHAMIFLS